ncbi:MAG: AAA family ATPase, partial [Renibacterium salmoninarum]|nr:AAA family ATPase [Renibacterium salmoninarum]
MPQKARHENPPAGNPGIRSFRATSGGRFRPIGRAGAVLLEGATGAGKSSVLDAICFALFASVPGVRQSG